MSCSLCKNRVINCDCRPEELPEKAVNYRLMITRGEVKRWQEMFKELPEDIRQGIQEHYKNKGVFGRMNLPSGVLE